jgi:hypothetical protein
VLRFVISLVFVCLFASVRAVEACSCMESGPPCQDYWKVSAVFLGRVESVTRGATTARTGLPLFRRVKFTVLEAYRGLTPGETEVQTGGGGGDCGYNFAEGTEYLVYAHRNEGTGVLTTGICSRTKRASEAAEDLAYARAVMSGSVAPGRIIGTVKLAERALGRQRVREPAPMAGVPVRLQKDGGAIQVASNAQGAFVAEGIEPGTYSVAVDLSPQYYAEIFPKTVEQIDAAGCAEVSVTVRYDGRVSGRIVDNSGRPVPGVTIELTVPAGLDQTLGPERIRVLSDRSGRYELTHVPAGTFVVGINTHRNRDGGLTQPRVFHPGVEALRDATRVSVSGGERVQLRDLILPRSVGYTTLEGIVLEPDGSPAIGARVYLKGPSESDYILSEPAITDQGGRFVLAALDGQSYRLFAERARNEGRTYRVDSSEQVTFAAGPDLPPFKLLLQRRY